MDVILAIDPAVLGSGHSISRVQVSRGDVELALDRHERDGGDGDVEHEHELNGAEQGQGGSEGPSTARDSVSLLAGRRRRGSAQCHQWGPAGNVRAAAARTISIS